MNRQRILQIVKSSWIILVFAGVIYYLITRYGQILEALRLISVARIALSFLLLIIGKIVLVQVSRYSLHGQPWQPCLSQMFYINTINQLAKYLPGGIWHFVGRAGVYKQNGLTSLQIGRSMLVENLWLLFSAIFVGGMASYSYLFEWLHIPLTLVNVLILVCILLGLWLAVFVLIDRYAGLQRHSAFWLFKKPMLLQGIAWIFIGLSYWVIIPVANNGPAFLLAVVGAFTISWAAGYITLFAPSGIGVRELVLSFLLGFYIAPQIAVVYSALSRIIWVITELILGLFAELAFGILRNFRIRRKTDD